MADETLLSDLCSICNTSKSKYCCPGCSARTCSLPCYKRHQQWAQCSGKRDPTAYVKKSQLATPAGIDHDFNFLTSIERSLEKAERDVNSKTLGAALSNLQVERKKGLIGDKGYEAAGVTVIRAPKGLSRQRENATHRNNRKNIVWTVEWIHPDKSRSLTSTSERATLLQAYENFTGPPPGKKRKREGVDFSLSKRERVATETTEDAPTRELGQSEVIAEAAAAVSASLMKQDNATKLTSDNPAVRQASPAGTTSQPDAEVEQNESKQQANQPELHFFLHRARTSSSRPVLIPLQPSATLNECLRGRTVFEFPTVYVFSSATPPADEFILEEEYLKQEREEQRELEEVLKDVGPEALQALDSKRGAGDPAEEEVDSKRILDVLKQDLGGGL